MDKILSFLAGKKTYIIAAIMAVLVFAKYAGFIDQSTYDQLVALLTGAGLATLRAAIK